MTLPCNLKLNDARKRKNDLFASLDALEIEVLDVLARTGGSCVGKKPGTPSSGKVVLNTRSQEPKNVDQKTVNAMVREGWLRFVPAVEFETSGFFWMTDAAQRVWEVLGRRVD